MTMIIESNDEILDLRTNSQYFHHEYRNATTVLSNRWKGFDRILLIEGVSIYIIGRMQELLHIREDRIVPCLLLFTSSRLLLTTSLRYRRTFPFCCQHETYFFSSQATSSILILSKQ